MNENLSDLNKPIDIIKILSVLWKKKSFILKIIIIFVIVGITYSLSLKNIYRASSTFYPHIEEVDNTQNLRNLAGLAGININNEISDNIPSNLYPKLINSPVFKIEILNDSIKFKGSVTTFRDYLIKENPNKLTLKKIILFPVNLVKQIFIKNEEFNKTSNNLDILKLSEDEYKIHKLLSEIIFINLNQKEGFIDLYVLDKDPYVASQIAKKANEILQRSIIEFKIKNINDTYNFVDSQLKIAKKTFYKLQDSLAIFKDKNINIKSDLFLNQFSRIESEYLVSKNIYNELAINKEKIAIDVKKNTPIFTIIKPVVIPNEKFSPNRTLIVLIFSFLGLSASTIYILSKSYIILLWSNIIK